MGRRRRYDDQQMSLDPGLGVDPTVLHIDEAGEHGEVFTRRWVAELILDLAGFTADRDLGGMVAVEPSCGSGAFLVPMTERLLASCERFDRPPTDVQHALVAFDLLPANVELARKALARALIECGVVTEEATTIATACVRCEDFLLANHAPDGADFVLGNPPYIRLEGVPAARRNAYRRACPTMRGRSDIFVGFIERGLRSLRADGTLGFIVADRWMHNQYGADLRRMVTNGYSVEVALSMHEVDAFDEQVSAYPAVTVIRRAQQSTVIVATAAKTFGERSAPAFLTWARSRRASNTTANVTAAKLPNWFDSAASWPSGNAANLALLADLERRMPPLESPATGTRVGIGVATGADDVYLITDPELVEHDRLLPLLTTRDIKTGTARWSGTYLVNPWKDGGLVDLDDYPRMAHYLGTRDKVRRRHVAMKSPGHWYRTIDRVEAGLLGRDKLLIPDLKSFIHPVLDLGTAYPHHGLYFVTSDEWDLGVLGGLLLSDIAELFVAMYCVRMRGGCYRFQAQYLRRIRVPEPSSIARSNQLALRKAFEDRDRDLANAVARDVYGLDARVTLAPG